MSGHACLLEGEGSRVLARPPHGSIVGGGGGVSPPARASILAGLHCHYSITTPSGAQAPYSAVVAAFRFFGAGWSARFCEMRAAVFRGLRTGVPFWSASAAASSFAFAALMRSTASGSRID